MAYERSPFGDNVAEGSGGNVASFTSNHYGPRDVTGARGKAKTLGFEQELVLSFSGQDVSDEAFELEFVNKLPAGALVQKVLVKVDEALALGGTSPLISIGTSGSEATNGFDISEAQAEAAGTYDVTSTLAGTWAAVLAAETEIGLALGGTSPTSADQGKISVVISYDIPSVA